MDLASKLEHLATSSFPTPDGIQHEGYEISSLAQVYRIKKSVSRADWENLADRARQLPNLADQAFVLSVVAESMPRKMRKDSLSLFSEGEQITEGIPSTIDRAEHYEALASRSVSVDSGFARRMLQLAMKTSMISDDPDMDSVQRRLVDLAYRLDPDLAASLSSIADDDAARLRGFLERYIKG